MQILLTDLTGCEFKVSFSVVTDLLHLFGGGREVAKKVPSVVDMLPHAYYSTRTCM